MSTAVVRAAGRHYYATHKEKRRESVDRYRAAHAPEIRVRLQKRRQQMTWAKRACIVGSLAKRRKNLSIVFLERLQHETSKCPCCDCELDYGYRRSGKRLLNSATLDKTIPTLGYVENNVAILCDTCNRMKNDMSIADAQMIVNYLERVVRESNSEEKTCPV